MYHITPLPATTAARRAAVPSYGTSPLAGGICKTPIVIESAPQASLCRPPDTRRDPSRRPRSVDRRPTPRARGGAFQ